MHALTIVCTLAALSVVAGNAAAQLDSPTAKATLTVGEETLSFQRGGCIVTADSWGIVLGDLVKGERFELNIPAPVRASALDAVKPTKDGSYTNVSLTVIPAGGATTGHTWHAGGRTVREADLTVVLKNNRRAGEFTGRTDGSPRQAIKGTFSC